MARRTKTKTSRLEMRALYGEMVKIRCFEDQVQAMSRAGLVPGLVHLYSGQEAVAVGVSAALRDGDHIASHHRGHGHCLARGADPQRLFAEILGRAAGYGMGRGGSMHIFDPANGNLGTNGIVGGGVPLATGAALSQKTLGGDGVAVTFFGDGAMNQGIVAECMNMAAIWSLPVIYVCENNHYGEFTRTDQVTAGDSIAARGAVFNIPSVEIDGMDVLGVKEATVTAVARARGGGGPSFLVCDTWRFSGHHAGDQQSYKDSEEARAWLAKDPIEVLERRLVAEGAEAKELAALRDAIGAEIARAAQAARAGPEPEAAILEDHLYAG